MITKTRKGKKKSKSKEREREDKKEGEVTAAKGIFGQNHQRRSEREKKRQTRIKGKKKNKVCI